MDRRTKVCWIGDRDDAFEHVGALWAGRLEHPLELRPFGADTAPTDADLALVRAGKHADPKHAQTATRALRDAGAACCVILDEASAEVIEGWLEQGADLVVLASGLDASFTAQAALLVRAAKDRKTLQVLAQHLPLGVAVITHAGEVTFQTRNATQLALGTPPGDSVILPGPDGEEPDVSLAAPRSGHSYPAPLLLHDPATNKNRTIERKVLPVDGWHVFVHTDLTERCETLRTLATVERGVLVGELARGVVHDLNNVFCVIESFAELAADGMDPEDPKLDDLKEIATSSKQGASLVSRLVTFARKAHGHVQRVDVADIVRKLTPLAKDLVGRGCELGFDVDPASPARADCEVALLEQVTLEALAIARGAAHRAYKVEVRVSSDESAVVIELRGKTPDEDPELDRFRAGRLSELSKELGARLAVTTQTRMLIVTLTLRRASEP